jgi:hypothetical protein
MTKIDINTYNKTEGDTLPANDWNDLHAILSNKVNELVDASNEFGSSITFLNTKTSGIDWSNIFVNSLVTRVVMSIPGQTINKTLPGNWAAFSLKSNLQVTFSGTGSTTVTYKVLDPYTTGIVPVLWVNLDEPEITAVDNVQIGQF